MYAAELAVLDDQMANWPKDYLDPTTQIRCHLYSIHKSLVLLSRKVYGAQIESAQYRNTRGSPEFRKMWGEFLRQNWSSLMYLSTMSPKINESRNIDHMYHEKRSIKISDCILYRYFTFIYEHFAVGVPKNFCIDVQDMVRYLPNRPSIYEVRFPNSFDRNQSYFATIPRDIVDNYIIPLIIDHGLVDSEFNFGTFQMVENMFSTYGWQYPILIHRREMHKCDICDDHTRDFYLMYTDKIMTNCGITLLKHYDPYCYTNITQDGYEYAHVDYQKNTNRVQFHDVFTGHKHDQILPNPVFCPSMATHTHIYGVLPNAYGRVAKISVEEVCATNSIDAEPNLANNEDLYKDIDVIYDTKQEITLSSANPKFPVQLAHIVPTGVMFNFAFVDHNISATKWMVCHNNNLYLIKYDKETNMGTIVRWSLDFLV